MRTRVDRSWNRPAEDRARDLLARMTLAEKCTQLTYDSPAIPRLDIPAYNWWNECLHGVGRAGLATVFPQAIGLAATFDVDLIHRVAVAISDEARAKHHAHASRGDRGIYKGLTFWSPNINIFRDPRWGRGHETYGECPYLTSRIGVAFVRGLQGDDPNYLKVIATPKHMAAHSGPEKGRHGFDAKVSEADLNDTYLPAFRATVVEGGAFSVMGAYNRINGSPCCASPLLLEQILRGEWGFTGYTVSDCGAITDLHEHHKITKTPEESAALAISSGLDLCCGQDYTHLHSAIKAGLVSELIIDRALLRLLVARFKLGMFDPPAHVPFAKIPFDVVDSPGHRALALESARRSVVLLKNKNRLLPLSKKLRSVAIIGPNADAREILLANYHGTPSRIITPLDGIREKLGSAASVHCAQGCTHLPTEGAWLGTSKRGFVEAIMAAERSDVSILCLGLSPTIEGEEGDAMNSDAGGDRTSIELPRIQQELLEAIVAVGKPVVLVLIGGSAMAIPWAQQHVGAIVQQFYPGQAGGRALADVLFGDHNPSGRLPVTVYRATADLPPFEDYSMAGRTYRYCKKPVLYPFGFGLSYTRFVYGDLRSDERDGTINISAKVRNAGKIAGQEIAQLYVENSASSPNSPIRQLAGVQPVFLKSGQSQTLTFKLDAKQFPLRRNIRIAISGSQPDARSRSLGAPAPLRQTVKLKRPGSLIEHFL